MNNKIRSDLDSMEKINDGKKAFQESLDKPEPAKPVKQAKPAKKTTGNKSDKSSLDDMDKLFKEIETDKNPLLNTRVYGNVKFWHYKSGYGYCIVPELDKDVFLIWKQFENPADQKLICSQQRISFILSQNIKGFIAIKIRIEANLPTDDYDGKNVELGDDYLEREEC